MEKGRVRGMKEERREGRLVDVTHGIMCYNGKTECYMESERTLTTHSDSLDSNPCLATYLCDLGQVT